MKRNFEKEEWTITFKKIKSFDEMLQTKTSDLLYTENEGIGVICYDGKSYITKHKTSLHGHPYYNLHNMVIGPQKINRDNFHTVEFTIYKRIITIKYNNKKYKKDEFIKKVYLGD